MLEYLMCYSVWIVKSMFNKTFFPECSQKNTDNRLYSEACSYAVARKNLIKITCTLKLTVKLAMNEKKLF